MKKEENSYAQAVAEVEKILEKFNGPDFDLDTVGADVRRATELLKFCKERLRKVEQEVAEALATLQE